MISDPDLPDSEVEMAFTALGPTVEPPAFWITIANSLEYSNWRRHRCYIELFRRHASAGVSLSTTARELGVPAWITDDSVDIIKGMIGKIPIELRAEDTVFVLRLPSVGVSGPTAAVYFRIKGKVGRDRLMQALRGIEDTADNLDLVVLEVKSGRRPP